MSVALVAFLVAIGVATWTYAKLQRSTGYGNNQSAGIGALATFVIIFIVVFSLGRMLLH